MDILSSQVCSPNSGIDRSTINEKGSNLTIADSQRSVGLTEKVGKLRKALISAQDPRLLNEILKHQINPLFNLTDSAIVYAKDGESSDEYQFYYNHHEPNYNTIAFSDVSFTRSIGIDNWKYFYQKLHKANEIHPFFTLNLDHYSDKEELHPFFLEVKKQGINEAFIVNLQIGAETVGFWVMVFKERMSTVNLPWEMLDTVSIQLAATVNYINTLTKLDNNKKENEVLQALNIDLAATRNNESLLNLVRNKLITLFQFSHLFIFKINEDQMTVSLMLVDSFSKSQYHPAYEKVKRMQINIADGIFNNVLISNKPVVFDLEKLQELGPLPIYFQINFDSGIRKVAMVALRVDSKVIGIWCAAFTNEQPIFPRILELLHTVSAPISIAVANIRINESLKNRETERDKLMELSFDLTTVKSKEEFIRIIDPFLRKFFVFINLSVFVDHDNYENRPFIYFSTNNDSRNAKSYRLNRNDQFKEAKSLSQLLLTPDVRVVVLEKLNNKADGSAFLKSEQKDGVKTALVIALRNDNRHIGVLSLYLSDGILYSEIQLHLFKEVSYQVSKAVSNILYNEEIAHREREKELLLALSEDIAGVREKDQLIQVIDNRLKPILKFSHISLSLKVSPDYIISFLNDPRSKAKGHREYQHLQRQDISQCEDFISFVDASPVPVVISAKQQHGFNEMPKFISVNLESGVEEILIARLFDGVSVFGYCVFFFSSAETVKLKQYSFLMAIANQFSTAIYNINANLEIAKRQSENQLLISLNNDSAGLRDHRQLINLVSNKLKGVFSFNTCFIAILDGENDTYEVLLPEQNISSQHFNYHQSTYRLSVSIKDLLSASDQPVIIDKSDVYKEIWLPICHDSALKTAVVAKFIHNNQLLGIWVMFFDNEIQVDNGPFKVLKGICDQLSIAVANIRINERLAKNERQKSLLLSLSTNVSSARNPVDLLRILASELKTYLKFSHGSIVLFNNDDKTFAIPWVLPSESNSSSHPRYKDITALTPVYDGVADLALKSDRPLIIDIAAFSKDVKMPLYMQVSFESGMTHVVFTKLIVNGVILGFWVIWYDTQPECSLSYLETVEQIASVLAIPISNISFNEKINKKEKEKTYLLDFIEAISDVKDKFELQRIFNHYLKNLCLIDDICMHWFTDDKKSQYRFFWNEETAKTFCIDTGSGDSSYYPLDDIIYNKLLASTTAQKFNLNELMEHSEAPPYLSFFSSLSFVEFIAVPLFKGKELIGILFVKEYNANVADQPLFKGLCTQLAIAVSDLITADKLVKQLSEINSYKERLEEEQVYLKQELETSHHYSEIIGESTEIRRVFEQVSQVASSDSTVLILGETGTGKELIARAIHNNSPRQNKLMVKVNCAALPANLIESELFGHERGSYTGATERRVGKFELANGGSLFLDEVGELPLELQVKFLRALQEREIERIGGRTTIKVDVRIIAATNRNLEVEVAEGRFRSDLYFRLSTFPIMLPSLRDRKEDIPLLVTHFVNRFAKKTGKSINTFNQKAMQELISYNWPGNIRELEHQIERSVLLAGSNTIKSVSLPAGRSEAVNLVKTKESDLVQTIDEHERALILSTIKQCFGKISGAKGAAAILGVPPSTLNSKMKRLGIKKNFLRL